MSDDSVKVYQLCKLFDGGGEVLHWFVNKEAYDKLRADLEAANKEIERLKYMHRQEIAELRKYMTLHTEDLMDKAIKTLEFYADDETYFKVTDRVRDRPIGVDLGQRAKQTLEKLGVTQRIVDSASSLRLNDVEIIKGES